jgi:hypothetical protein
MAQPVADEEEDETFLRGLVLPQEDCMRLGVAWTGGWRWFRSPNVVCLEQYRQRRAASKDLSRAPNSQSETINPRQLRISVVVFDTPHGRQTDDEQARDIISSIADRCGVGVGGFSTA